MRGRSVLAGCMWLLTLLAGGCCGVAGGSPDEADRVSYLFVQRGAEARIEILAGEPGYALEIGGVDPITVWFSDRPRRLAGRSMTREFVRQWQTDQGADSFKRVPPNASLELFDGTGDSQVLTVELRSPRLEGERLFYRLNSIDGGKLPQGTFQQPILFIDSGGLGSAASHGSIRMGD